MSNIYSLAQHHQSTQPTHHPPLSNLHKIPQQTAQQSSTIYLYLQHFISALYIIQVSQLYPQPQPVTLAQMSKKLSTRETTQKPDLQQSISQIFALFDSLFGMRLVDRICRPIPNNQRLELVSEYKIKFNEVHQKLATLSKMTIATTNNDKNQQKTTRAHKPADFKNSIRKIQQRYNQLFRDGSFKHYDRVSKLHGLPQNMYLINIQNWTNQIINSNSIRRTCC